VLPEVIEPATENRALADERLIGIAGIVSPDFGFCFQRRHLARYYAQRRKFNVSDSVYASFIQDCVEERASLIGLMEAMQNKMLAPGMPIAIP
jgi:hypothetical protein